MAPLKQRLLIGISALLWLLAVIGLFYAGHKPFTPQIAITLAKDAGQIAAAASIIIIGGGLGRRLLRETTLQAGSTIVLQASLGLGLLGLAFLVVGSTLGVNPLIGWIFLVLLAILLRREIFSWIRNWSWVSEIWLESGRLEKTILLGAVFAIIALLPVALSPPLKFDALVYHLVLPRAYLDAGKVIYTPQLMYWGMPQTGEMLYTWAMSLAGTETASVLCWLAGVLALFGILGFLSERLGRKAALVAVAALLSTYTLLMILPTGYIDWLVVLFGFSFMAMMDSWWSVGTRRSLVFAGMFAGFALGSKYTAGVLLVAGIMIIIARAISLKKRRMPARPWLNLVSFVMLAVVITLPWWLKNLFVTGNPFYPFFFTAGSMDHYRLDFYHLPAWGDWRDFVFLPLRATINGFEGAPGYSATISPLLLGLCPFALLGWRERPATQKGTLVIALVIGASALLTWGIASRLSGYLIQSRLYFAAFPAFALLAGAGLLGISNLKLPGIRLGRIAGVLVLLVFGFTLFQEFIEISRQGSSRVFIGLESTDSYLGENLGWYYPATQAILKLPSDARVLMLFEPRSFYCQPICIPDEVLDRWKHDRQVFFGQSSILANWRNAGFTYLLFNKFGADFLRENDARYDASDWVALDQLVDGLSQQADFGGSYYLYSLKP